jgi:hypothetical protein
MAARVWQAPPSGHAVLDGAMTTIVIGLAAVVVLILVVVLLALRYLRADDSDDFDDMPDERHQPRRGTVDRAARAADRRPAPGARAARLAGDAEPRLAADHSGRRPARGYDRPARPAARDFAGGRSGQRAAVKYDDDRHGDDGTSRRHQDSLPAVRPRPARGKRSEDDGDWPSTKWDELSDVDYWAEVASDKPLTTTAQPASQGRPARPGPARDGEARQAQGGGAGGTPERTAGPRLPVREARPPAAAGLSAAAARPAAQDGGFMPAPHAAVRSRPEGAERPAAALSGDPGLAALARRDGMPPSAQRLSAVSDDDPLTSPSFPRIAATDSRSYHGGRADTPPSGSRSPAPYAATQQFPTYRSPSGQFGSYDPAERQPARPTSGLDQPGSLVPDYPSPQSYRPASADPASYGGRTEPVSLPPGPSGYQAGYLPAGSTLPAPVPPRGPQGAPSGNPYGSYVGPAATSYRPGPPAGRPDSSPPAGYGGHAVKPGAQRDSSYPLPASGEASAGTSAPASGWSPEFAAPAAPAASYLDVSRQLPAAGIPAGGYLNGSGHAERASYPAVQHEPTGYLPSGYPAAPHEPTGSAGPDPYGRDPYGRDPYGGYPGYGASDR